jgi:hypothetical protein
MKPVEQSRVGQNGRCLSAVIASILEIPEAAVPDFLGDDQPGEVSQFLRRYGLYYVEVPVTNKTAQSAFEKADGPLYHVMLGISPRGGSHAVVADRGKMAWDPHPISDGTGQGLVKVQRYGLLCSRADGGRAAMLHRALDRALDARRTI